MQLRNPRDVGLAIRERRRSLGLDQKTLAQRVGVGRQWLVEAEKGKRRAELGLILRTFEALGLTLRAEHAPAGALAASDPVAATVSIDAVIAAHRRRPGETS
jgi:HTH-type transcriptional regulator/antitoxin HipB